MAFTSLRDLANKVFGKNHVADNDNRAPPSPAIHCHAAAACPRGRTADG